MVHRSWHASADAFQRRILGLIKNSRIAHLDGTCSPGSCLRGVGIWSSSLFRLPTAAWRIAELQFAFRIAAHVPGGMVAFWLERGLECGELRFFRVHRIVFDISNGRTDVLALTLWTYRRPRAHPLPTRVEPGCQQRLNPPPSRESPRQGRHSDPVRSWFMTKAPQGD